MFGVFLFRRSLSVMKSDRKCSLSWSYLVEPAQLLYVLMFSVSLIHMDKIYVDKVCQVNLKEWIESNNLTIEVCSNLTEYGDSLLPET